MGKRKRQEKTAIIAAMLLLTMMCVLSISVSAQSEERSMVEGLPENLEEKQVYYGQNGMVNKKSSPIETSAADESEEPILWRIMDTKKDEGGNPETITLLSEYLLGYRVYDEEGHKSWSGSDIALYLNGKEGSAYEGIGFIDDSYTQREREIIEEYGTTETNNYNATIEIDQQIVLPSYAEVAGSNAWFSSDVERVATKETNVDASVTSYANFWWLRSPGSNDDRAASVFDFGYADATGPFVDFGNYGIRPAFRLNLESVLFTSAAIGGKSATEGSGLVATKVATDEVDTDKVKFTLLDEEIPAPVVALTSGGGTELLTYSYSNAPTYRDKDLYISCVLIDADGAIAYYGRLAKCSNTSASGTFKMSLEALVGDLEDYQLKFFYEEYNGDKKTDYAGELAEQEWSELNETIIEGLPGNLKGKRVYYGHNAMMNKASSTANPIQADEDESPIRWRIMENDTDTIVLMSEYLLGYRVYHTGSNHEDWSRSDLAQYLNGRGDYADGESGFIDASFDDRERNSIELYGETEVTDKANNVVIDEDQEIVLPSYAEVTENWLSTDADRKAENAKNVSAASYANYWWLRSPGSNASRAASVSNDGFAIATGSLVNIVSFGIRPAFRLNLESVLFTSAAAGGKSVTGGSGPGLVATGVASNDTDWKFTLRDSTIDAPKIEQMVSGDADILKFSYGNAPKRDNLYISCILTDENGAIAYYGRLAECADKTGTFELSIAGLAEELEDYNLKFFYEEYNGDYNTDYAGAFTDEWDMAPDEISRTTFENVKDTDAHLYVQKTVTTTDERYPIPDGAVFTFVLSLDGKLAENVSYRVYNQAGAEVFQSRVGNTGEEMVVEESTAEATDPSRRIPYSTDRFGTFTLKAGQTAVFEYLGAGTAYKVTETAAAGYEQTAPAGGEAAAGTVLPEGSVVSFVNQYTPTESKSTKTSIVVNKGMAFPAGYEVPESPAFTFVIKLKNKAYAREDYLVRDTLTGMNTGSGTTDDNGRFTLKVGETAIFENIPVDVDYEVSEEQTDGWWIVGETTREGATYAPAVVLNYTNACASFAVTKTLSDYTTPDETFTFVLTDYLQSAMEGAKYYLYTTGGTRVDDVEHETDEEGKFTLRPGQTAIFLGIAPGTIYNVSEEGRPDYIQKVPGSANGYTNKEVTNAVEVLPFVNEPAADTDALTVTKIVTGKEGEFPMSDDVFTFRLTVEEAGAYQPVANAIYRISAGNSTSTYATDADGIFRLKRNETARFETLKKGAAYRVEEMEEELSAEYEARTAPQEAILDGQKNFTFKNEYEWIGVQLQLHKQSSKGDILAGAQFNLYADENMVNQINDDPMESDAQGNIILTGLKAGTYYLVEQEAPSGYRLLANPIQIQIVRDVDGVYAVVDAITYRGTENQDTVYIVHNRAEGDEVHVTVVNHKNFELPVAGGIGIIMLVLAVLSGMIFLSVRFIRKRRMELHKI